MKEYYIEGKKHFINVLEGQELQDFQTILLFVHGLGGHMQYVYNSIDDIRMKSKMFASVNYKTFGFEFQGHGKSKGPRGTIYNFNDIIDDLQTVINHIEKNYKQKNIILIGESMGGAVIIKYITERENNITGIVLLSPLCGLNDNLIPSNLIVNICNITSKIIPWIPYPITANADEYCLNEEYKIQYNNNKYTYTNYYPLCTINEIYKTSINIINNAPDIKIPIFIIHGENDKITSCEKSKEFINSVKDTKKKIMLIPNKGHNLLVPNTKLDIYPDVICHQILDWIESIINEPIL